MKMRSVFIAICGGLLTGGFALSGASAAIVGTSGDLTLVAQPASLVYTGVAQVQSVSPSLAGLGPVIFSEFSGRMVPDFTSISPTLTGFDGIDISTSGRFPTDPLVGTQVLTGQTMDSFIIHFDPNEYSGSVVYSASGSVVFDRPIFGVQTTFTLLREGLLDLPNIQLFGSSGLELYDDPQVGDQLTLSSDLKTDRKSVV